MAVAYINKSNLNFQIFFKMTCPIYSVFQLVFIQETNMKTMENNPLFSKRLLPQKMINDLSNVGFQHVVLNYTLWKGGFRLNLKSMLILFSRNEFRRKLKSSSSHSFLFYSYNNKFINNQSALTL